MTPAPPPDHQQVHPGQAYPGQAHAGQGMHGPSAYVRSAPTPRLSERGPWWVQALISTGVVALYILLVVGQREIVSFILNRTQSSAPLDFDYDVWKWFFLGLVSIESIVFAVIVAVWARTTVRTILAPLAVVVFHGSGLLLAALINLQVIRWDYDWNYIHTQGLLTVCGYVLGWTISRRRTNFTWIGLPVFFALTALYVWLVERPTDFATYSPLLIIGSVLVFWACDGLGMLSSRRADTPPTGFAASLTVPTDHHSHESATR